MLRWRALSLSAVLILTSIAAPASVLAQSIWLEPYGDRELYLEILKPQFDAGNLGFLTTNWYLTGRLTVSEKLALVAELPFAYAEADAEIDLFDVSDATIGNPYLGVELHSVSSGLFGELGLRIPLAAQRNAGTLTGLLTDFVDRTEAFLPDVLTLQGALNYGLRLPSGFGARFRAGSVVWLDVGDGAADTEVSIVYSGQAWYDAGAVVAGGGLSGRWVVTAEGDLGETTVHQLVMLTDVRLGQFRPGIQLRIPIDKDLNDALDLVFGLKLALAFP
jgi:hypothetical protein